MKKMSINFKLLTVVCLAIAIIAGLAIGISAVSAISQLNESSKSSHVQFAQLLTTQQAGNIKFDKQDGLAEVFDRMSADPDFNFAFAQAFKPDASSMFQQGTEPSGIDVAALAGEAMAKDVPQATVSGSIHIVATPAHFGKDNATVGALVVAWDLSANTANAIGAATRSGLISFGTAIAAAIGLAFLLRALVTRPLVQLTETATRLANREYDTEVPHTSRGDEIGEMARAVEVFRENGLKVAAMTEEQTASAEQRRSRTCAMMQELQNGFRRGGRRGDCRRFLQAGRAPSSPMPSSMPWPERQQSGRDGGRGWARPARCWRRWPRPT